MKNTYELIIIGGGPAGITAGIYAARKKINTLLISKDFSGQTGKAFTIENYPGFGKIRGIELMAKFKEHLEKFKDDIDIKEGEIVTEIKKEGDNFNLKTSEKNEYSAKAVIITSGRNPRPLQVPGENKFTGKGVSYCTTCDGPLFSGKTVAVIGGGNAGAEAALDLAKQSPKVYIFEMSPKLRADEATVQKINNSDKIEIVTSASLKEIKGDNFVESMVYQDLISKKMVEITLQGIFVEIGSIPATSFIGDLADFTERKEIKADPYTGALKTPGLFAAGDVTDVKYKQIVIASGRGAITALSAYEYLENIKAKT